MVVLTKKKGESKDNMFRKFTRLFVEDRVAQELKDREYYKRPSQINKEKKKLYASRKKRRRKLNAEL